MKTHYLTILRDKETQGVAFRTATKNLCTLIAADIAAQLPLTSCSVETPLQRCAGERLQERVVLIPILRSGLVLLPAFVDLFPEAPIGFFGIRRDEKTALPHLYYENIPLLSPMDRILLLDPMLATGGSALLALHKIKEAQGDLSRVILVTIVAAPAGIQVVEKEFPRVKIHALAVDEKLNAQAYIIPGLGDFGDRYFGTGSRS